MVSHRPPLPVEATMALLASTSPAQRVATPELMTA
jgi:hypothetical protein